MARQPRRKTQATSVASYAICSELRARIRLQWRTMRRRSSQPRRKPSLRPPSRNIPRWQRRALPSQSPGRSRGLRLSRKRRRLRHERKRSSQQAKMRRHTQSANKRRHEPLPARRETNRLCRSRRPTLSRKNRQKLRPRWCRHRVRINLSMARAGTKTWSRLRQRLGRLFQIPRAPAPAGRPQTPRRLPMQMRCNWSTRTRSMSSIVPPRPHRRSRPAERYPRVLVESQRVVEMWIVEDAPELIYCLAISPRLIGNHALDLTQRKREKCVAAAVQSRSYRLGTDEFAESHHRRGVGKVVRRG